MICRQQASEAVKKVQVVEEYLLRKKEAAAYKARAQQWLMVCMSPYSTVLLFYQIRIWKTK